jgi:hypothetical protein
MIINGYTCIHLPIGTRLYPKCKIETLKSPSVTWSPPEERSGTCNLSELLRDMSEYHLSPNYKTGHSGDLLDHSLWTYYLLVNEISLPKNFQSWFMKDIPSSYYPVLQVSGLLHDIGKAGDLKFEYTQKLNHPLQGWLYFEDKIKYIWIDGSEVSLTEYLSNNCNLTSEEWQLVSIIIRLHYDLGNLFEKKLSVNEFLQRLNSHFPFDPLIIFRLLRAVTFADIWAQKPVSFTSEGYIKLDPDIIPKQRRPSTNNTYLNEEKFAFTRILENQIIGIQDDICIGPIKTLTLDPNSGESVITTKPINLIVFTHENIKNLLTNTQELDLEIYQLITNKSKIDLRKYFLQALIIQIQSPSTEARNEIYHWYFSAERNKLSTKSIQDLIKRLKKYSRVDWNDDKIDMTIRRLTSSTYNLENFITEYDENEKIKQFGGQVQILMKIISPLQPNITQSFQSWDDLIEIMSQDHSFKIPLLSPKGLLTLKTIIHNSFLDNLLKYILMFITKYDIYGFYDPNNGSINLLFTDSFVRSEF